MNNDEATTRAVFYFTRLQRIAGELTGIDRADLTPLERRIYYVLEELKILTTDDH